MARAQFMYFILMVSTLPQLSRGRINSQWPLTQRTILWEREKRHTENAAFVYGSLCPLLKPDSKFGDGSFYYDGGEASVADFGFDVDRDDRKVKYTFTMWLKPDSQTSSGEIFEYKSIVETTNRVTSARGEMVNGKVKFTVARSSGDIGSVTSPVSLDASKFNSVLLSADDTLRIYVTVNDGPEVASDLQDWRGDGQSPLQIGGTWRLGEFFERTGQRYVGKINCITFFEEKIGTERENEYGADLCTNIWDQQPGSSCPLFDPSQNATTTAVKTPKATTTRMDKTTAVTTPEATTTNMDETRAVTTPEATTTRMVETTAVTTPKATTTNMDETTAVITPEATTTNMDETTAVTTSETTITHMDKITAVTTPEATSTRMDETTAVTTSEVTNTNMDETTAVTTSETTISRMYKITAVTTPKATTTRVDETTAVTTSEVTNARMDEITRTPANIQTRESSPEAAPVPTATIPSSQPQPVCLWPLDDVTGGYDIMAGSPSLMSLMTHTCFRTDTPNPELSPMKSFLMFDGSLDSIVKMEMESSVWDADFTVVVFVKPQQPPEGLIWTYSAPQASLGISRIEVSLRYDSSLVMTIWDSGLQAPCGQIVAPELFNNVSKFSTVIVGRNALAVKLQVDDNAWVGNDSCPRSTGNAGQGLMEVGGRGEGQSAGYRGHVVCMTVFSQYVSTVDDEQLLSQCGDYDPAPYLGANACNPTAEMRTELFKLFARNKAPDVTRFPPMTSFQTSSAIKCATCCMHTLHCKSFTFWSDAVTSSCSLFDVVTLRGLGDSKGNYYEITSD